MKMVETVARAILKSRYYDTEPEMYGRDEARFQREIAPDCLGEAMYEARAAIQAMLEPTDAVIAAVEAKAEERYRAAPEMQRWYGDEVFVAGIRAALSEDGGRDGW